MQWKAIGITWVLISIIGPGLISAEETDELVNRLDEIVVTGTGLACMSPH